MTLLYLALLVPALAAATPSDAWLAQPCALLPDASMRALYDEAGSLSRQATISRRESDCLLVDTARQRSLRLVLHPARDAARVGQRLQQLQADAERWSRVTVDGQPAVLSRAGDSISWGRGPWMLTLAGSERLPREALLALVARINARLGA